MKILNVKRKVYIKISMKTRNAVNTAICIYYYVLSL